MAKVEISSAQAVAVVETWRSLSPEARESIDPAYRALIVDLVERIYTTPEFQNALDGECQCGECGICGAPTVGEAVRS